MTGEAKFEIVIRYGKTYGPMKAEEIDRWIETFGLQEGDDSWIVRKVGSPLAPPPRTLTTV